MKNLYTLALAATITFSAAASDMLIPRNGTFTDATRQQSRVGMQAVRTAKSVVPMTGATIVRKAAPAAAAATTIDGDYTILIGDYYWEDSPQTTIEEECSVSSNGSTLTFSSDFFMSEVPAEYDESTGTITFTTSNLGAFRFSGSTTVYYIQFAPAYYDWDLGGLQVVDSYEATYNEATGTITFPQDHSFTWIAFSDENYTQYVNFVDAFDVIALTRNDDNPNEGWTSLGNARFMDGWLLPAFGIDQNDEANQYDVELQQNDADNNIYRLVNPYHGDCPLADYNQTGKRGYIQFDVTDPNHVVFASVPAGFVFSQLEISTFYCLNALTYWADYIGGAPADAIQFVGNTIPYTTFKDGVVSLGKIVDGAGMVSYDACFGDQSDPFGGYTWQNNQTGEVYDMTTRIIFPKTAIESIGADKDVPAVYYNLQGIRVDKPANGAVYIKRTGDKSEKVRF